MRETPTVSPHLHVPLQSGDDVSCGHGSPLLGLDLPPAPRSGWRGSIATTDVIVGFPGEDDAAFEPTLRTVEAAGITKVHVFPYSPRPGTVNGDRGHRVPPAREEGAERASARASPTRRAGGAGSQGGQRGRRARRSSGAGLRQRLLALARRRRRSARLVRARAARVTSEGIRGIAA